MKVGTDGVLLGTWADIFDAQRILDVGCGSGLIALMLAQRSQARIDAIDLDENAYRQTLRNIELSPFNQQVKAIHGDFLDYHPNYQYNLILSNPPFFVDSLKSPDGQRTLARHTDDLPFDKLLKHSIELLSPEGRVALILPFDQMEKIAAIATACHLHIIRTTAIRTIAHRPPKRILVELGKQAKTLYHNVLCIESSPGVFSDEYLALTKDFYLKPLDCLQKRFSL
jgi:tRNA1Val (adenine37-N6)-methyltransferase